MIWLLVLFLYWAYLYLNRLVIQDKDGKYLARYHLLDVSTLCRWLDINPHYQKWFLHRIYRADKDRDLHNHPWSRAESYVLWGGYAECVFSSTNDSFWPTYYYRGDRSFLAFLSGKYHRITHVLPNTWTLFMAGPRDREWYFWTENGPVVWYEYLEVPQTDLGD